MANKQILSVVAATVLAASFTLTGCGSSSSGNKTSSSSSSTSSTSSISSISSTSSTSSSSSVGPVSVTVSDAYVLEANVTMGGVEYNTVNGAVYEWTNGGTGEFATVGGANDTNRNSIADAEDPIAPNMKAPAGYANINPFTTMLVNGMTLAELQAKYPSLQALTSVDIDVVTADLAIYKDAAKAGLELSGYQEPVSSSSEATSSSSSSVQSTSSSVSSAASSTGDQVTPPRPAGQLRNQVTPCRPGEVCGTESSASVASSVSSEATSSEASTSSAVSSTSNGGAYAAIDAAATAQDVDAIVKTEMGKLNGYFPASASSVSSVASSSSTLSSSSVSNGQVTPCRPGEDCTSSASSEESSSSVSSVVSSVSSTSSTGGQITPPRP